MHREGAELAFTYQGEALEKRVRPLAESVGSSQVIACDVTDDASIDTVFSEIEKSWGKLDFLLHSIAFAPRDEGRDHVTLCGVAVPHECGLSGHSDADVGMHAIQTSGNTIRNVTADHFAGAAADEIADPRPVAELIRQWSTDHPEFQFLPRKFKIAVTGSPNDRTVTKAHDIGLRMIERDGETMIPDGSTVVQAYDHVYAIAAEDEITRAMTVAHQGAVTWPPPQPEAPAPRPCHATGRAVSAPASCVRPACSLTHGLNDAARVTGRHCVGRDCQQAQRFRHDLEKHRRRLHGGRNPDSELVLQGE